MRTAILLLLTVSCGAQSLADFAGTWVQKYQGRNFRVIELRMVDGKLTGNFAQPAESTMDGDGDFTGISAESASYKVTKAAISGKSLELTVGDERYSMSLTEVDRAALRLLDPTDPFPAAKLERTADREVRVASNWPAYSEEIRKLQERLQEMVKADQAVRTGPTISRTEVMATDAAHRAEVLRIHEKYGWPVISAVGKEASSNYWLLVQHQDLDVMRMVLPDLERAAGKGDASKQDYAYLFDRVQKGSGKPQHWGTQASCKNGKPELDPVDDPAGLEERRKALFMGARGCISEIDGAILCIHSEVIPRIGGGFDLRIGRLG
jgi:hypothetical protein